MSKGCGDKIPGVGPDETDCLGPVAHCKDLGRRWSRGKVGSGLCFNSAPALWRRGCRKARAADRQSCRGCSSGEG